MTLVSATDGNHGRGVAWAAEQLGLKAVIYMPKGSAQSRVDNIRAHGATVHVTDLNYDDTVRLAGRMARENGWHVIQDTASKDEADIPRWIMQGYTTMSMEAIDQMGGNAVASHPCFRSGRGGLLCRGHGRSSGRGISKTTPPVHCCGADPCRLPARFGRCRGRPTSRRHRRSGDDHGRTGLRRAQPDGLATVAGVCSGYVSCDDYVAANGMRILANPLTGDDRIEAGESGAVGIGLLDLIANLPDFHSA